MTQYVEKKEEPIKHITPKGRCKCSVCGSYEFNILQKADEHGMYNEIACAKCGVHLPFVQAEVR